MYTEMSVDISSLIIEIDLLVATEKAKGFKLFIGWTIVLSTCRIQLIIL